MPKVAATLLILLVLVCGLFFLATYPSGGVGKIGSSPRPLRPGRVLIEIESSTRRSDAINDIARAVKAVVGQQFPTVEALVNAGDSSSGGSANYVVWNRLYWSHGINVRSDAQFHGLLDGWKDALDPTFDDDRLRVLIEYQPLDGTSTKRYEFDVRP